MAVSFILGYGIMGVQVSDGEIYGSRWDVPVSPSHAIPVIALRHIPLCQIPTAGLFAG